MMPLVEDACFIQQIYAPFTQFENCVEGVGGKFALLNHTYYNKNTIYYAVIFIKN